MVVENSSRTVFIFRRDLVAELPFTLMHPKPEEDAPLISLSPAPNGNAESDNVSDIVPIEDNLIQLDT